MGGPGDTAAAARHLPPRGEAEGVLSGHSDLLSRISCFSLSRKQTTVPSRRFGYQRRHWAAEFPLESRSQNPVCVSLVRGGTQILRHQRPKERFSSHTPVAVAFFL